MITLTMQRSMRGLAVLGMVPLALSLATAPARAQAVGGSGYAAIVRAFGVNSAPGQAVLPDSGGFVGSDADNFSVPGALSFGMGTAMTSGAMDVKTSAAQTTSQVENVSLLNGLITARTLIASASSVVRGTTVTSNALGSTLSDLTVAGVPVTVGDGLPAPNTRMSLPGVGYVILNQQQFTGDGVHTSGITVNLIHVVLTNLLGQTVGEIVVGSASSAAQH
jgi:hypothetical protein